MLYIHMTFGGFCKQIIAKITPFLMKGVDHLMVKFSNYIVFVSTILGSIIGIIPIAIYGMLYGMYVMVKEWIKEMLINTIKKGV